MLKIKTLLHLGALALAITLPVQPAFSQTAAQDPAALPTIVPITELTQTDTQIGSGAEATDGKVVSVHFTGWIYSYNPARPDHKGMQYDSSIKRGQPLNFVVGAGRVIKGLDQGVVGMKVGGKRTLIIPSESGYGARGFGRGIVPRNAALVMDVELVNVK